MEAEELKAATVNDDGMACIKVWNHKTVAVFGPARIVCPLWVYDLAKRHARGKQGEELVFTTAYGGKLTHIGVELERLGKLFGKNLTVSATTNRKATATAVALAKTTDLEVRSLASYMTHSVSTAQAAYQHITTGQNAVTMYQTLEKLTAAETSPNAEDEESPHTSPSPTPTLERQSGDCDEPPSKRRKAYTCEETALATNFFRGKATPSLSIRRTRCLWDAPPK